MSTIARARALRSRMTPQEVKLWVRLRALREQGLHFRRQAPLQGYILDFVCFERRLVVEIDGAHHGFDIHRARDARRDAALAAGGLLTLRFWNSDIESDLNSVIDTIFARAMERTPTRRRSRGDTLPTRGRDARGKIATSSATGLLSTSGGALPPLDGEGALRSRPGGVRKATPDILPLLIWLSPAFPVGAFAYSHGIEWAVECGDIADAKTLHEWIADLLHHGSIRNDAILLAAVLCDPAAAADINALALALSPSKERRLETVSQGNAFIDLVRKTWPHPAIDDFASRHDDSAYPVALGVAAAAHGIELRATIEAFALAFVSNLVSAAVRLGPIGQTDGQRIIAALLPDIRIVAGAAATSTLDDLGSACFRADIASMKHETQYSRLFRS
jgi:urease accessory protein